jgi:hypothetical protein
MGARCWCEWAYIEEGSDSQAPKNTFLKKIECTAKMGKTSPIDFVTSLKNKGKRKAGSCDPASGVR